MILTRVNRVARFADAVRRRVAIAHLRRPNRSTRDQRRVEQVLRMPTRRRPTQRGHQPLASQTTARISLRIDVHQPGYPPAERLQGLRTVLRREHSPARALAPAVPPMRTVHVRQFATSAPHVPTYANVPVPVAQRRQTLVAVARRQAGPVPVPQVHRQATATADSRKSELGRTEHRPSIDTRLGVRWTDDRPDGAALGRSGPTALTAADLPHVVGRVVRELDRRVTAARERKGWTG
ncbi:hypothetical protein ACWF0M_01370 [Kribbella sp. NPDC055110]